MKNTFTTTYEMTKFDEVYDTVEHITQGSSFGFDDFYTITKTLETENRIYDIIYMCNQDGRVRSKSFMVYNNNYDVISTMFSHTNCVIINDVEIEK